MKIITKVIAASMISIGMIGCASDRTSYSSPSYATASTEYGRVTDVERVWVDGSGRSTGAGAVVGGIIGGVLGHQVGSGRGNDAATVAGAVGGAVVGNEIEKNRNADSREVFRVTVRLDGGGYRTVEQDSIGSIRIGDNVRIIDGYVTRN